MRGMDQASQPAAEPEYVTPVITNIRFIMRGVDTVIDAGAEGFWQLIAR